MRSRLVGFARARSALGSWLCWALGLVPLAGCGEVLGLSSFVDASGGAGGMGGAGGGGAGGAGGGVECTTDAECEDGLACNGSSTCGPDGTCVAGKPFCEPVSDPACELACTEGTPPLCGAVTPKDADGDGVGTAACTLAAGSDCDDANDQVGPQFAELCDGLDNDCDPDGLVDEGLPATGASVEVGGSDFFAHAAVAYSAGLDLFGVSYVQSMDPPTYQLRFVNKGGNPVGPAIGVGGSVTVDDPYPAIAASNDRFVVVWEELAGVDQGLRMQVVDGSGALVGLPSIVDSNHYTYGVLPRVVATPTGDFVVAWKSTWGPVDEVVVQRVSSAGALLGDSVVLGGASTVSNLHLVRTSQGYAAFWSTVDGYAGRSFDDQLALGPVVNLGEFGGKRFAVARHPSGVVVAGVPAAAGNPLFFQLRGPDLSLLSESGQVGGLSPPANIALVATEDYVLLLESFADVEVEPIARLHRFDIDTFAAKGLPVQVSEGALIDSLVVDGGLAGSPQGVGLFWTNRLQQIEYADRVMFRVVGPRVCD